MEHTQNYYGSLCTEMYEILHERPPLDELDFYLSYAEKGQKIFEPLCGSGRFFLPFLNRGYKISGVDLSAEMLAKLKQKAPAAKVAQADVTEYNSGETYDYIFIPSGSISLFTDLSMLKAILRKIKALLNPGGKFVFAVDTVEARVPDRADYTISVSVKTQEGFDLILKNKNQYDEATRTQFSPSIYELYDGSNLLQREYMDFQTHLYEPGEMEGYLYEAGFTQITVYADFDKKPPGADGSELFLYECGIE